MRRSLIHYRRLHLAVLLASAVATAVLTGALLVGDSVRGSLRDLTLERLGKIDHALVAQRFFREELSADLAAEPAFAASFEEVAPAILLPGSATAAHTRRRASRVQVIGAGRAFAGLEGSEGTAARVLEGLRKMPDQHFAPVVVNQSLQRELQVEIGDPVLLSFENQSDIQREFVLGRRNSAAVVRTLRLTLAGIVPDHGLGRLALHPHQNLPLNAFVALSDLQKALERKGRVNALFAVAGTPPGSPESTEALQDALHRVLHLDDLGLTLRPGSGFFALESKRFVLQPHVAAAARELALEMEAPVLPILTYLATSIKLGDRAVPYSTIAAFDAPAEAKSSFGAFELIDGSPAPLLVDDEILLNEWAARDLGAEVGDPVEVSYFVVGPGERLQTEKKQFRLRGVVALSGMAVDPRLTPEFPGLQDRDDMSAWDPPFALDLNAVRRRDEVYWDDFGATPKAFAAATTGRRLWRSRFGDLTAMWVGAPAAADLAATRLRFQKELVRRIRPGADGLAFQPVKARGLEAAAGATDFGMLFTGFSFFLIISAALMAGLLFRLGVERRAGEIGVLLAVGYPLAFVRWRFMVEGGILAGIGSAAGAGGAVLYASLLMAGLRTWWSAAVGTPFLDLHVQPLSLAAGFMVSVAVVLVFIGWTVRQCGRAPVRALLSGTVALEKVGSRRRTRLVALAGLGTGGALPALTFFVDTGLAASLFFASGTLLLVAGLALLSLWLRRDGRRRRPTPDSGFAGLVRMGIGNSSRHPGRSMICAALVGCACFTIVAVGANRSTGAEDTAFVHKESGLGGFALLAEADIPLHNDLNTTEGRGDLGFAGEDTLFRNGTRIFSLRSLPGEDVSCLNLYQPQTPRLLGTPPELIARGGFQFQQALENVGNPWRLLEERLEPGVIAAIGDYNSARWILHRGLGDDVLVRDEKGRDLRLRLVGLLKGSIFQGELLISETNFKHHFPGRGGYGYFLIQTTPERAAHLASNLERALSSFGFDVIPAAERLADYRAVENTYLSTFQTLGGLGLLWGTLGLGILLLRNVIERRGELATLRVCGFRHWTLVLILLAENGFLLGMGILIGALAALVAVAPHLLSAGAQVSWFSLVLSLFPVLVTGLAASAAAALWALREPLLPALKAG